MTVFITAQDFDAVNKDFTFSPGATFAPRQCFNVSIRPDRLVERSEFFSLVMSSDSLGVMLEPATALVTITDQDGKATFFFYYHIALNFSRAKILVIFVKEHIIMKKILPSAMFNITKFLL